MPLIEGRTWLEVLPAVACDRHLRQEAVGRVAVVVDGHPEIFPVNYAVDADGSVVFRTGIGTKLDAVVRSSSIAFEVDGVDEARRMGWSVLVVGQARWVATPAELAQLRELRLEPWAVGDKSHYVRLSPTKVTGRRIHKVHDDC